MSEDHPRDISFLWNFWNSTDECNHTHDNVLYSITRKADDTSMCHLRYQTWLPCYILPFFVMPCSPIHPVALLPIFFVQYCQLCGISLLLDSHLVNIQQFLLKVCQTRFPQNSICSENSHEIPFAPDLDSTPNSPGILPCVWCTTEWHHTNTKQKSCLLVLMTQSHAMSDFHLFSASCLQDNNAKSAPSASSFSQ